MTDLVTRPRPAPARRTKPTVIHLPIDTAATRRKDRRYALIVAACFAVGGAGWALGAVIH